ncbi:hypothetical protein BX666DRAFT_1881784 [Dichotomocladium elegans]|nr:hypothetical protein BX666DRAFT_1881784 [Dichotomocladium elegans]
MDTQVQSQAQQYPHPPYWQPCYYVPAPTNMTPPPSPPPSLSQQSYHSPRSPASASASASTSSASCSYYGQPQYHVPQYYYYCAPVFYNYPPPATTSPAKFHNQQLQFHQPQRHRPPVGGHNSYNRIRRDSQTPPAGAAFSHHHQNPWRHSNRQRPPPDAPQSLRPPSHAHTRPPPSYKPSTTGEPPLSKRSLPVLRSSRWETSSDGVHPSSTFTEPRRQSSVFSRPTTTASVVPASPHRESIVKRLWRRLSRTAKT